MKLSFIVLLALAFSGRAANWYVDSDVATNGTGTSWASAWKEQSNIVWASVSPGDTIWISGGTYTSNPSFQKGGTVGNPITWQKSTEAGHSNLVLFTGPSTARISGNGYSNIRLIGWNSDPSAAITNALLVTNLSQYVGVRINQTNSGNSGILFSGSGTVSNVVIEGFQVDGVVNDADTFVDSMGNTVWRTQDNPGSSGIGSGAADNYGWRIRYNIIRNVGQDGIGITAQPPSTPDDVDISYNLISYTGDDGIEVTGGVTIRGNQVGPTAGLNGHPDSIVVVGDGNTIVDGNLVHGYNTYFGFFYGASYPTLSNLWIVNNTFPYAFTNAGDNALGITVDQTLRGSYTNFPSTNDMVWSDIKIINNTIVGSTPGMAFVNRYRPNNTSNTNYNFHVLITGGVEIENNLFIDPNGASTVVGLSLKGYTNNNPSLGYGIVYDPDVASVLDLQGNILASTNQYGRQVLLGPNPTYHPTILDADAAFGFGGNFTNRPSFDDYGEFYRLGDYRIPYTDTAARAKGTNLTSKGLSWLNKDFLGRPRPSSGNWTIGAYEAEASQETNLLVLLTFEDNYTATNYIADTSGFNHHFRQWGFTTNPAPNWVQQGTGKVGSYAGSFAPDYAYRPYTDTNFWSGRYAGTEATNLSSLNPRLTNMPLASVFAWAKFNSLPAGSNSTIAHNATIFDAGYGVRGAWHFGRYYSTSIGNMRLLINTNAGAVAAAPQLTWDNGTYTNDTWNHYGFTFNSTNNTSIVVNLYFNGSLLKTTNILLQAASSITGLRITDAPGSTNGQWLALGAWQHNGTPTLDDAADGLPNNGWMDGLIDNVRIYDRTLSDAEIQALYVSEAGLVSGDGNRLRKTTQLIGRRR